MLFEMLERHAADRPAHEALICGDERLTWGELHQRALRLSLSLRRLGLGPDDTVTVLMPNSVWLVVTLLALARIGVQAMLLTPNLTFPEIRQSVQQAGSHTVLAADCAALEPELAKQILQVSREDYGEPSLIRMVRDCPNTDDSVPVDTEAPFIHFLTSGTTGSPKRVIRTQGALGRLARAYCHALDLTPVSRILCVVPLHYAYGFEEGLLGSLQSGGPLILAPSFERRTTLRLLQVERIACFFAPPFVYSVLARSIRGQRYDFPALRWALTSGAPLTPAVFLLVRDALGILLRQVYGTSETGHVTMNLGDDLESSVESVGRPMSGAKVEIAGDGNISVFVPWAAGWVASSGTGGVPVRLADADGWIRLSDLGRFDADGRLYLTGRKSRFINLAGRKIDPAEVEAVLESHPGISKAIVSAMRDEFANESLKATVYCSHPVSKQELGARCGERLASYKVPRIIEVRDETNRRK